uniref:Uncharacterized protein n=1 Tax=Rousettus bat poxvirus TaxID=3141933 RepID=A0AAU7E0L4_9POXV
MGIKNLKSLLLEHKSMLQICAHGPREVVFVDFMGTYIAAAYSVSSVPELKCVMDSKMREWRALGARVTLFVDYGQIAIKTSLRLQRRANLQTRRERKQVAVAELEARLQALDQASEFYEEERADLEAQLTKSRFFMHLSEGKNLYYIMDVMLRTVPEWVSVVYCHAVDAEFEMCVRARAHAQATGEWPVLLSYDQDTLCLSCTDALPKVVHSADTIYLLRPCAYSMYLVKLTLLINGCDFLPGLRGVAISPATLPRFKLFREFTVHNLVRTLVFRNYNLTQSADANIAHRLAFINRYVDLDKSLYSETPPTKIAVHDFLASALRPYWRAAVGDRVRAESPLLEKIYAALVVGNRHWVGDAAAAVHMMEYYRAEKPTRECVLLFIHALGFRASQTPGLLAVCPQRADVFLCYGGEFYFNDRAIIENGEGLINICL